MWDLVKPAVVLLDGSYTRVPCTFVALWQKTKKGTCYSAKTRFLPDKECSKNGAGACTVCLCSTHWFLWTVHSSNLGTVVHLSVQRHAGREQVDSWSTSLHSDLARINGSIVFCQGLSAPSHLICLYWPVHTQFAVSGSGSGLRVACAVASGPHMQSCVCTLERQYESTNFEES